MIISFIHYCTHHGYLPVFTSSRIHINNVLTFTSCHAFTSSLYTTISTRTFHSMTKEKRRNAYYIHIPSANISSSLSSSSLSTSNISSVSNGNTAVTVTSLNRKNTRKKQKENEMKLQSLVKSSKIEQALSFYASIWEDYCQYNQYCQSQSQPNTSNKDDNTNMNTNTNDPGPAPGPAVPPTVRLMNYAINACARAKPNPFTQEALQIYIVSTGTGTTSSLSSLLLQETTKSKFTLSLSNNNNNPINLLPNVYTFGSLIRVYARIGDINTCIQILNEMKNKYNIVPNSVIYSTIISACEHLDDEMNNVNVKLALQLFQEATTTTTNSNNNDKIMKKKMDMNIVVYNTVLSVFAKGGEWKLACQLLDEMEGYNCESTTSSSSTFSKKRIVPSEVNIPPPDHITYGTVMAACERAKQWKMVLKVADRVNYKFQQEQHMKYQLDGVSISSALKACQQLGLADDALKYLNQMKQLSTNSGSGTTTYVDRGKIHLPVAESDFNENDKSNELNYGRRKPLQAPDDVAYRLAISACARSGYIHSQSDTNEYNDDNNIASSSSSRWIDGIRLLREMEEVTGSAPDVIAYTAAIGGCAVAGEYKRAIQLLKEMKSKGVEPNVVTFTAVISACASACAKKDGVDGGDEYNINNGYTVDSSNDFYVKAAAMKAALAILDHMTKNTSSIDIRPNIFTYNAAIRACAEGQNVSKAFALLDDLKERNLQPTIVTYGTLMTACERVGDVESATKVFRFMKQSNIKPNEIVYGAAISCFRKASQSERALILLRKMIEEKLSPNTATFNTVIMSQTESRNMKNVMEVYELMKNNSNNNGKPNRQTFTMLIQYMINNSEPSKAEYFLREMRENGMKPDVNLCTATVTAYERNREPRKALALMESMRADGYDFYDIKVLDAAFKQGVKLINNVVKKEY